MSFTLPPGVEPAEGIGLARSWLLLPGSRPDRFAPWSRSAVDALVLDLEDGVAVADKPAARDHVASWLSGNGHGWVRIADFATAEWEQDLRLLRDLPGLVGVMLAKTESAEQVDATAAMLRPRTPVIALVESALGIENALDIARAEPTARLAFGVGDYRRDTGAGDDTTALAYPRSRLVVASRAARLPAPIDGPNLTSDPSLLEDGCAVAVTMGMRGKLTLDPDQAVVINAALAPSPDDIGWARSILHVLGENGANIRDGSDAPRLARAHQIIFLAKVFNLDGATARRAGGARQRVIGSPCPD